MAQAIEIIIGAKSVVSRDRLFSRAYLRFCFAVFIGSFVFNDLAPRFRFAAQPSGFPRTSRKRRKRRLEGTGDISLQQK